MANIFSRFSKTTVQNQPVSKFVDEHTKEVYGHKIIIADVDTIDDAKAVLEMADKKKIDCLCTAPGYLFMGQNTDMMREAGRRCPDRIFNGEGEHFGSGVVHSLTATTSNEMRDKMSIVLGQYEHACTRDYAYKHGGIEYHGNLDIHVDEQPMLPGESRVGANISKAFADEKTHFISVEHNQDGFFAHVEDARFTSTLQQKYSDAREASGVYHFETQEQLDDFLHDAHNCAAAVRTPQGFVSYGGISVLPMHTDPETAKQTFSNALFRDYRTIDPQFALGVNKVGNGFEVLASNYMFAHMLAAARTPKKSAGSGELTFSFATQAQLNTFLKDADKWAREMNSNRRSQTSVNIREVAQTLDNSQITGTDNVTYLRINSKKTNLSAVEATVSYLSGLGKDNVVAVVTDGKSTTLGKDANHYLIMSESGDLGKYCAKTHSDNFCGSKDGVCTFRFDDNNQEWKDAVIGASEFIAQQPSCIKPEVVPEWSDESPLLDAVLENNDNEIEMDD